MKDELPRQFFEGAEFVEHLRASRREYDETDAAYRVLVSHSRRGSSFARAALWLGLWPALDGIYRRQLCRLKCPDAALSEVGAAFTAAIASADLDQIHQLAATLVGNTERRATHVRVREERNGAHDTLPEDGSRDPLRPALEGSALGMSQAFEGTAGLKQARAALEPFVGPLDAALLCANAIEGESQQKAAARHGLRPDAGKKRIQRALRLLRGMSLFDDDDRVYRSRGQRPPRRARR